MKVGDVLARYKPAERTIRILLDGSIQSRIDEIRQQLKRARRTESTDGLSSPAVQLEAQLKELEEQADGESVAFTLRAIPGADFDKLKHAYPPTEEAWERFREVQKQNPMFASAPEFDVERLAPDLIGLSMAEVDGEEVDWSAEDGQELWGSLHDGARADLFEAAWAVNGQRSTRPLSGTATGTTSNSGSGSTTPQNEESPTPNS